MIHPDTQLQFINPTIGFGVVATKRIPRGTITWTRDSLDQVLSHEEVQKLTPLHLDDFLKFSYLNGNGEYILCWDIGRFVNHSCDPNVVAPGFDFEIAVRDIEPGQQIMGDYATYNLETGFDCFCETQSCRRVIQPTDREQLAPRWDELVRKAFDQFDKVQQPLWSLVVEKGAVELALRDATRIPSCRVHFFEPGKIQ